MTSLTKTAILARKIIRYGLFFIIFLIIARILFGAGTKVYRYFFPAPPPAPTVTFGKLPKLEFPQTKTIDNVNLSVQTPEGGLPTLPTQAKVFFMPKVSASLLSLDSAISTAQELGYIPQPQKISETTYRFSHKDVPATLEMNIANGNFSISFDLSKAPSVIQLIPPAPEVGASKARSYLSGADLLPDDLSGPTSHQFLKIQEGKLVTALGQSDAQLVKINFFRKSYDNLPAVTPNPDEANVWFYLGGGQTTAEQIIAAEYHYFPVDESQSATYPIKTAQQAFDELKGGSGYVAKSPDSGNITLRRVYLAYYDSGKASEFYQPVVVFEGEGFMAYVPAVTADYYGD